MFNIGRQGNANTDTQVIIQKTHTHKDYINRKTLTKYGVLFLVLLF